jgi:hypothetical protein
MDVARKWFATAMSVVAVVYGGRERVRSVVGVVMQAMGGRSRTAAVRETYALDAEDRKHVAFSRVAHPGLYALGTRSRRVARGSRGKKVSQDPRAWRLDARRGIDGDQNEPGW